MFRGDRATVAATIALLTLVATWRTGAAEDLELSFDEGRVTVVATEIPLRTILDEWSRRGDTTFVETHHLSNEPVSVQLVGVPEGEALEVLLRTAGGYVVAPRAAEQPGASTYDRVLIMAATGRRPRRPATFARPSFPTTGQPELGDPMAPDETELPEFLTEPEDSEVDQLELLEQLRGRYQSEAPPPDPFSRPSIFTPDTQQDDGTMQATPRPGMLAAPTDDSPPNRRPRAVRPQRDDP